MQATIANPNLFLTDGQEARLDVTTGKGKLKLVARRPVLFQLNALHLNNLKGAWTLGVPNGMATPVESVFQSKLPTPLVLRALIEAGDRPLSRDAARQFAAHNQHRLVFAESRTTRAVSSNFPIGVCVCVCVCVCMCVCLFVCVHVCLFSRAD